MGAFGVLAAAESEMPFSCLLPVAFDLLGEPVVEPEGGPSVYLSLTDGKRLHEFQLSLQKTS